MIEKKLLLKKEMAFMTKQSKNAQDKGDKVD